MNDDVVWPGEAPERHLAVCSYSGVISLAGSEGVQFWLSPCISGIAEQCIASNLKMVDNIAKTLTTFVMRLYELRPPDTVSAPSSRIGGAMSPKCTIPLQSGTPTMCLVGNAFAKGFGFGVLT